jgi:tripartite-type tricarboxylate transporter receptor subunit TctC
MAALAHAKPDGYTILVTADGATIGPALHSKINYDPVKDIQGVAAIGSSPYVIAVNPGLGATTLQQLVELMKSTPEGLNASASGNGTRLAATRLGLQVGAKIEIISFNGTAEAATSVVTGESDFSIMGTVTFAALASSGKVALLAVCADRRLPQMPDTPTTAEAGLPGFTTGSTFGLYAVKGTPPEVLAKLNQAVNQVLHSPDVQKVVEPMGVTIKTGSNTVEDFENFYLAEMDKWKAVVAEAHFPMAD